MTMELKIWGFNLGAIAFSIINDINPLLSTIALLASIVYTVLQIKEKLKK
jgi:lipoprotein signal peptidase